MDLRQYLNPATSRYQKRIHLLGAFQKNFMNICIIGLFLLYGIYGFQYQLRKYPSKLYMYQYTTVIWVIMSFSTSQKVHAKLNHWCRTPDSLP